MGWHTCNIWYEQIVECGSDVQKAEEWYRQDRMKLKKKIILYYNYIIITLYIVLGYVKLNALTNND